MHYIIKSHTYKLTYHKNFQYFDQDNENYSQIHPLTSFTHMFSYNYVIKIPVLRYKFMDTTLAKYAKHSNLQCTHTSVASSYLLYILQRNSERQYFHSGKILFITYLYDINSSNFNTICKFRRNNQNKIIHAVSFVLFKG